MNSFFLFYDFLDPYRMDQDTNQLLQKRLLESWSSKGPTWGEESSILAQKSSNSPLFCDGPAKNQQTKLIRL
jgi:hypothetical protein